VSAVLEADRLGKRYGRRWALADCSLEIPGGRVVGLVGPNGAGKTTLLRLAVGLLRPNTGSIRVLGEAATDRPAHLGRVGFVAQDAPIYGNLSVLDHLRYGAWSNDRFDGEGARRRAGSLGLDLKQRAGRLSGGQRAQLALTLALAKRPELLVLDEPAASLDPLSRRELLQKLMEAVVEHEFSVILSSHLVTDLERVCDYLVVLVGSRLRVAGPIDELLAAHHRLIGPRDRRTVLPDGIEVVDERHTDVQSTLIVRQNGRRFHDPAWSVETLNLEDLVLAYIGRDRPSLRSRARLELAR
jgi:ABC-2 type transport system ATP-binding protein